MRVRTRPTVPEERRVTWFRANYPDVADATINTHMAGLTVGSRPHAHLARYAPVMERVGHGLYRRVAASVPTPRAEVAEVRSAAPSLTSWLTDADALLIGCVKSKQASAAEAKDLYTSALFVRRRTYAERSGKPWFVVSARLGLVGTDEVIAPYDVYLPAVSVRYRRAWGEFVAAQLSERMQLRGAVVEIHAGDAYVHALRGPLTALEATVRDPVDAGSLGETLSWYDRRLGRRVTSFKGLDRAVTVGEKPSTYDIDDVVARLGSAADSLSVAELLASEPAGLAMPGMYSWWVDKSGARQLSVGLGHEVNKGLTYIGQAGATRWPSGQRSTNTLWGRLVGMHLGSRAEFSTFRRTLGSVLQSGAEVDEPGLTEWMAAHLRVVTYTAIDADAIDELETKVLNRLDHR